VVRRPPWTTSAAALAVYLAVSVLYFGVHVLAHPGRTYVGTGSDPGIFIWSLAWWPHAVLHGVEPVVTHALSAPAGVDLAWTTSIPGLAVALAPVTLAAGPVVAYNVAAILLPALAAWTAFLLCRHVTGATAPSLAGGYLFGFSTYMLGQELGHLHLSSVFLVPLVALVVLRFLEGTLDARGLVVRLSPLLALQFAFSTEVFFTVTLAIALALAIAVATVPALRERVRALLAPLAGAYAGCAVLVSPLLAYALTDFRSETITPTEGSPASLVSFVAPTALTRIGARWAETLDPLIPAVSAEHGQYLGLPTIAIVVWLAWERRRSPGIRFLVAAFAAAVIATFGSWVHLRSYRLLPLPWLAVRHLPLFDNVIPLRLSLYVSLAAAVAVAVWAASPRHSRWIRVALTAAAIVALAPNLPLGIWHTTPPRPAFFAAGLYRSCLPRDANVLVLPPPSRTDALLWQAESEFRYRMANGSLSPALPHGLPRPRIAAELADNNVPPRGVADVLELARAQRVDAILVTPGGEQWRRALDPALHPRLVGGVALYSLRASRAHC
jgi:hypothetical protein